MERKFQRFSYADSDNSDIWFIFQNVYGKNEFVSLVFMFTSVVMVIEDLAGHSKKSINSTKSIKIIDHFQEMVLTRVLEYHSWDLGVWDIETALSQQVFTRCL